MAVVRRGKGWQASYRDAAGRERTRTFPTKREAQLWESDQKLAVARGGWDGAPPRGSRPSCAQGLAWYVPCPVMDTTTRTLGDLIRLHRKAQGISQREFGALFQRPLGQTTVAAWECNQNRPTIHQLPELARLLKVSLDALLEPFQP